MGYQLEYSNWNSNILNKKCGRLVLDGEIGDNDISKIINKSHFERYDFITIRNQNNNARNNYMIQKLDDVFLTDVNVQFMKTKLINTKEEIKNIHITNSLRQEDQIVKIAGDSFMYSRYKNDPKLGDKRQDIYSTWVKNSFYRLNKYFCIYQEENVIKGFILFFFEKNKVVIDLMAVDEPYQRMGIGHQMMSVVEDFAYRSKANMIQLVTQIDNITSQNFYSNCGYQHMSNHSIYHWWC